MFPSLSRSWALVKESMKVLRKDPELMIFPVISFIMTLLVGGMMLAAALGLGSFDEGHQLTIVDVVLILAFYLGTYFATIYCQVALVASVKKRLSGGDPTVSYGMGEANKRLGAIASWTVIAAVVGMILMGLQQAARRNTDGFGRIVSQIVIGLVGAAWSLAVFFVIPVIAYEGVGGFTAIKRSLGIVKNRWGEAAVGQGGISLALMLIGLAIGLVFGGLGVLLISTGSGVGLGIGIALIAMAVIGVLTVTAISAALQSVYVAVLYEYATTGKVGVEGFSPDYVQGAFKTGPRQEPRGII